MKVRVNKDVIVYEEEGELVLVNMIQNTFYTLDYVGSIIWKKVEETGELAHVIDGMCEEFDEDEEVIRNDVRDFIHKLEEAGVVEVDQQA